MELYSTWTGTYSFVFDLKAVFEEIKRFLSIVSNKIELIEERIS